MNKDDKKPAAEIINPIEMGLGDVGKEELEGGDGMKDHEVEEDGEICVCLSP
jgi:hypothetical protein